MIASIVGGYKGAVYLFEVILKGYDQGALPLPEEQVNEEMGPVLYFRLQASLNILYVVYFNRVG